MTDPTPEQQHPLADDPLYIETQKLIRANLRREGDLAQAGVELNPVSLQEHRLELLIAMILPYDSRTRLEFETEFAKIVARSLDDAEQALAQARMAGKAPTASGLIVPGR